MLDELIQLFMSGITCPNTKTVNVTQECNQMHGTNVLQ